MFGATLKNYFTNIVFYIAIFGIMPFAYAQSNPQIGAVAVINDPYSIERVVIQRYISGIFDSYEDSKTANFPVDKEYWEQKKWFRKFKVGFINILENHDVVDLYILGHTFASVQQLTRGIPKNLTSKIRLIYMAGCKDGEEKNLDYFISQGAQIVVGHPYDNSQSAFFAKSFIASWIAGKTAEFAIMDGNENVKKSWITRKLHSVDSSIAVWKGNGKLTFLTFQKPELQ